MKRVLISLYIIFLYISAFAVPANRKPFDLVQPDGSLVRVMITGDERCHFVTDMAGHVLVQGKDRFWRYASFDEEGRRRATSFVAGKAAPSSVLLSSMPSPAALEQVRTKAGDEETDPSDKELFTHRKCLVLLATTRDKEFKHGVEEFEAMFNRPGYSDYGATGSVMDYFNEQFRGDLTFEFTVCPPVVLDGDSEDYFGNNDKGNDRNAPGAVKAICLKAAQEHGIQFSDYDVDGDGYVDSIIVLMAGKSEADGGDEDCVWPHMADLRNAEIDIDGVYLSKYNMVAELQRDKENKFVFTGIGTICHEFSHILGLMDMYDTDYEGSGGIGSGLWYTTCIMDGGNYNNEGRTPPHFNAVDYDTLGLGSPEDLDCGDYLLEPVSENRRFLRYETGTEGEYFLIECRDGRVWDSHVGGTGLLIYHIDKSTRSAGYSDAERKVISARRRWLRNEINCRPDFQCAALVSATPGIKAFNSNREFQNNQPQVFWPCKEYNAFTTLTTPAFVFRDGTESPLAITQIRMVGDKVAFTVSKMSDVVVPEVTAVDSFIFQDAALLQWEADIPEYASQAYVTWGTASSEGKEVEVEPYMDGKYALTLEGLSPGKAYKAVIEFRSNGISSKQVPVNFTTKFLYEGTRSFIYVNNLETDSSGAVAAGSKLPLRVYNLSGAKNVEWSFEGKEISVGGDGFWTIPSSGRLMATITLKDGSKEYIVKDLKVK
ncbi:MAG: M6 family metalloprotease domain-containing protein [Bacteroidales bacterium]|nr:M6 family metalloprotease domain-containing protein [Bacteroidales bacterium]